MAHSRETMKLLAGNLLEVLAPWVRRDLDADRHSGRFIKLKRWILCARTARARARGDTRALQKSLFQFWRTDTANDYFDRYQDRYQKWFLGPHHEIVDQLAKLARSGDYNRLVEVGCGAGRVLEHCANAMPGVRDFIGVDINPVIIARDKTDYAQNPRLQFLAADASIWLEETAQPGTILLTYGGVMEYFSADTLASMFRGLAQHHPAAVALVEPVDPNHDLANDPASHAFGQENSFSHNHEKLLQNAGFKTLFRKELRFGGVSWVMLLAATGLQNHAALI
jgi:trans-aconitate methyltransferase